MKNLSNICKVQLEKGINSEYIGISICDGKPQIIFPIGYRLSSDKNEQRKDILLLIKVFDKYIKRKGNKSYSQNTKELYEGEGNDFPFLNALWLIRDYENNGLYNEYIHNYKVDKKGNINWARTIKTQIPYISNNKLVYLDFVVRDKKNDLNHIILLIQMYIIEKCIDNIGWIYPNVHIDKGNKLPYSENTCINILKRELRLTNTDTTKQLITHMIEFLRYSGKDKSNKKLQEYKTKYFMNIWEDMLNVVLGNEKASEYYPNAKWNIDNKETNASNLRPDIILKTTDKIYVIDAKYYKYGVTRKIEDLPQSSDITKQLLYSSYIKSNFGYDAYDSFILPYKSTDNNYFKFVGNATVDIDKFKGKKVVCLLADMKKIMEQYIYIDELEQCKKSIIEIIEKENSKVKSNNK